MTSPQPPVPVQLSGLVFEIGDIQSQATSVHGFAIRLDGGQVVTVLGLTKEQTRALVPHFCEDMQITFAAPPIPATSPAKD